MMEIKVHVMMSNINLHRNSQTVLFRMLASGFQKVDHTGFQHIASQENLSPT